MYCRSATRPQNNTTNIILSDSQPTTDQGRGRRHGVRRAEASMHRKGTASSPPSVCRPRSGRTRIVLPRTPLVYALAVVGRVIMHVEAHHKGRVRSRGHVRLVGNRHRVLAVVLPTACVVPEGRPGVRLCVCVPMTTVQVPTHVEWTEPTKDLGRHIGIAAVPKKAKRIGELVATRGRQAAACSTACQGSTGHKDHNKQTVRWLPFANAVMSPCLSLDVHTSPSLQQTSPQHSTS